MTQETQQKLSLGARLKVLRENKGLTKKYLADFLNITPAAYLFYEQGKSEPSLVSLKRLAIIFDVSADYLLGIIDDVNDFRTDEKKEFERLRCKYLNCGYDIAENENFITIIPFENSKSTFSSLKLKKDDFYKLNSSMELESKKIEEMNFKILLNIVTNKIAIQKNENPFDLIESLVPVEYLPK